MATGEDEPKLIVLDSLVVQRLGIRRGLAIVTGSGGQHNIVTTTSSKGVDGLEPADGHQPGAGTLRHTITRPLHQGGLECLLKGFLGRVEVAEKTYERRQGLFATLRDKPRRPVRSTPESDSRLFTRLKYTKAALQVTIGSASNSASDGTVSPCWIRDADLSDSS